MNPHHAPATRTKKFATAGSGTLFTSQLDIPGSLNAGPYSVVAYPMPLLTQYSKGGLANAKIEGV
jgi:hypothetical protein